MAGLLVLLAARCIIVGAQSPFDTHDVRRLQLLVTTIGYPANPNY